VTILAVLMALGIIAYGWQHYQHRNLNYLIEDANKERAKQIKVRDKLRADRQSLRSSERIDRYARKNLNMVVPAPGQVLLAPAPSESEPELEARQ
jgi:cell division protein FtsL